MNDRVHIDYETYSTVSLPSVGVGRYSRHPTTEVLMGAWSLNDVKQHQWSPAEGMPIPRDLKEALEDPHVEKWAWNAPFEINTTRNVLGIDTPLESWRCTMVLALTCSLPGKLEKAGPVVDLEED
jgi:DNA polymerase